MSADVTSASPFTEYTIESAPADARRLMTATRNHLGYLPAAVARMAARLDAIRVFTLAVLDTAGDVGDQVLRDFLAHSYTTQNALEVVLGIGTYTMSTLANRLTGAPVDDQLAAFA